MSPVPPRIIALVVFGLCVSAIAGCGGSASLLPTASVTSPVTPSAQNPPPPSSGSTAGSTAPPTVPTNPAPPAPSPGAANPTGTTIGNIEQMPGWESCDTCSGGGQISYSMSLNYPQPGTTQFSIGRGDSWAHALWWKRLGNDASPSHFVLSLDQSLDNPDASFGIEYDANQIMGGEWYDFAIQCSFGYGIWQVWDDASQKWVPTSVPCVRPAPSAHVQLRLEFERSNGQAQFVSIGTNGSVVPVNMAFNPQPITGASGDFGVHIQLNSNANPDAYSVWVHNLTLTYW